MFFQAVLTVFSFIALVAALPFPLDTIVQKLQPRNYPDQYTLYLGDGSTNGGWPSVDHWMPFDDLFNRNQPLMMQSCSQFGVANDIQSETSEIYTAIQAISSQTGVDNRFILAIMMQESGGCVRAPTTNWGVRNPGLMQSHNGQGTCNEGSVSNPCPQDRVTQMIHDGSQYSLLFFSSPFLDGYRYKVAHGFHPLAAGTSSGDGLLQILNQLGGLSAGSKGFYRSARTYNSGSIAASGNLQDGIATHCYASDVANRLLGWAFAPHGCSLG
ncbi:hypothetical protein Egran_06695 [Elaphomyces granulatus]|uniref:Transglycosylase SLT domain-containing protein n=1 Tax=Elaphomyces granulatus TaxID=519963 RepID=A0A232LNZ5_9EURO|nr:hypothetical protein Egran_06695 [Elaphomyces granulatus]